MELHDFFKIFHFGLSLVSKAIASWNKIQKLENQSKFELALTESLRLLNSVRSSPQLYIHASSLAYQSGNETAFYDILNQALFPKNLELLELRGKFFFCDGDIKIAIRHFKTCRTVSSTQNCTILYKSADLYEKYIENVKKYCDNKEKKDGIFARPFFEKA